MRRGYLVSTKTRYALLGPVGLEACVSITNLCNIILLNSTSTFLEMGTCVYLLVVCKLGLLLGVFPGLAQTEIYIFVLVFIDLRTTCAVSCKLCGIYIVWKVKIPIFFRKKKKELSMIHI